MSRKKSYSPGSRRAAAHESAHADDAPQPHDMPHDHPMIPRGPAPLVTTESAFADLLTHLRDAGTFAYDSEFIGELTYIPKLCLIQVATATQVALIDPLAGFDLTPFWEILCDRSIRKIVHAGEQDIEPVVRNLGCAPANIFDTQLAAGFVGLAYPVSLSKLVGELSGARIGKGLTFSHWDQRPLSAQQLRYAADDVRYLPAIHAELERRLAETGHAAWAGEEFATLCNADQYRFDPHTAFLRVRGSGTLSPQALVVLRELVILRDQLARQHNVPVRQILRDEVLIDLARSPARNVEKLAKIRGLPRPIESQHGQQIVEATLHALSTDPKTWPSVEHVEPTPSQRFAADALWAAAQCVCIGQSVDPNLATSRQEIGDLHRHLTTDSPAPAHLMTGWRKDALGDPLTRLMTGAGQINLTWTNSRLRATAGR